jgi:DNA-directed RNA polymerase specialized sigma24 family protein
MRDSDTRPTAEVAVDPTTAFEEFVRDSEPQLRRALVAAYGPERGRDGVAEALGWAWEHWERVRTMDRPIGYLYRVGQSRTRGRKDAPAWQPSVVHDPVPDPELRAALMHLTERQRVAVVLVHGFGYPLREVAELLGLRTTSVQNHVERGLRRLRHQLEDP